jgi:predicted ester cyclase
MNAKTPSKDLILEQMDLLWNEGETAGIYDLFADEFIRSDPRLGIIEGPHGMTDYVQDLRGQYPDLQITFLDHLFAGDKLVLHWRYQGTDIGDRPDRQSRPTGKRVDFSGVDILRFEEGKIVEDLAYYNLLAVLQQLGLIPALSL